MLPTTNSSNSGFVFTITPFQDIRITSISVRISSTSVQNIYVYRRVTNGTYEPISIGNNVQHGLTVGSGSTDFTNLLTGTKTITSSGTGSFSGTAIIDVPLLSGQDICTNQTVSYYLFSPNANVVTYNRNSQTTTTTTNQFATLTGAHVFPYVRYSQSIGGNVQSTAGQAFNFPAAYATPAHFSIHTQY